MIMMTKEEIEKKIMKKKYQLIEINDNIINYGYMLEQEERNLADLEKQLAELDKVDVYKPIYLSQSGYNYAITKNGKSGSSFEKYLERHNAGEELKKLISEENQKQGWKVDWEDAKQKKFFIKCYMRNNGSLNIDCYCNWQHCENELYFSEQSSKDQDFLDKIKPLWLKGKGIE